MGVHSRTHIGKHDHQKRITCCPTPILHCPQATSQPPPLCSGRPSSSALSPFPIFPSVALHPPSSNPLSHVPPLFPKKIPTPPCTPQPTPHSTTQHVPSYFTRVLSLEKKMYPHSTHRYPRWLLTQLPVCVKMDSLCAGPAHRAYSITALHSEVGSALQMNRSRPGDQPSPGRSLGNASLA
jgi:hypothetical protein